MSNRRSGLEQMVGGIVVFGICLALYSAHLVEGWIIWPGVFVGVLPFMMGLRRIVRGLESRRSVRLREVVEEPRNIQRSVLQVASRNGGTVTPAMVALNSDLSIENADKALQDMAAHGYAEMRIRDNGTIEYHFADLR